MYSYGKYGENLMLITEDWECIASIGDEEIRFSGTDANDVWRQVYELFAEYSKKFPRPWRILYKDPGWCLLYTIDRDGAIIFTDPMPDNVGVMVNDDGDLVETIDGVQTPIPPMPPTCGGGLRIPHRDDGSIDFGALGITTE